MNIENDQAMIESTVTLSNDILQVIQNYVKNERPSDPSGLAIAALVSATDALRRVDENIPLAVETLLYEINNSNISSNGETKH